MISRKRIKTDLRIPVAMLQNPGTLASLIHDTKAGAEALAGLLMLLSMDGVGSDMIIAANGFAVPLSCQNIEALFSIWMPQGNAKEAVAALFDAGLMTMSEMRIVVPFFDQFVHTEGESASRMRAKRAQRKGCDDQSVAMNGRAQCDGSKAHTVTEKSSQSDGAKAHNVTEETSQCDTALIRKERLIKEKNKIRDFKEREEKSSAPLLFASRCSEESVSGWRDETGCGTVADVEPESSDGWAGMAECEAETDTTRESCGVTCAEMQADVTGIVAAAFKSAELIRQEPMCSTEAEIPEMPMRHALASRTPEEPPVEWDDVTWCGAQADAQQDNLNSLNTEPQVEALGIDLFRANSARLRERPLLSRPDSSSRPPRMDPRELLKTGRLSFAAKPLLEAFAAKCPSLAMKASTTAENLNALVAEALKNLSPPEIERVFDLAESSDFLTGRDGRMREAPVTLDWLLQPRTITRILQGEFGVGRDKTFERRKDFEIEFVN